MEKFKAQIEITLREGILDVQGKAVRNALHSMEYPMIDNVRIGKFVTLSVDADSREKAIELVDEACKKLIANPIIEDYKIVLE